MNCVLYIYVYRHTIFVPQSLMHKPDLFIDPQRKTTSLSQAGGLAGLPADCDQAGGLEFKGNVELSHRGNSKSHLATIHLLAKGLLAESRRCSLVPHEGS